MLCFYSVANSLAAFGEAEGEYYPSRGEAFPGASRVCDEDLLYFQNTSWPETQRERGYWISRDFHVWKLLEKEFLRRGCLLYGMEPVESYFDIFLSKDDDSVRDIQHYLCKTMRYKPDDPFPLTEGSMPAKVSVRVCNSILVKELVSPRLASPVASPAAAVVTPRSKRSSPKVKKVVSTPAKRKSPKKKLATPRCLLRCFASVAGGSPASNK